MVGSGQKMSGRMPPAWRYAAIGAALVAVLGLVVVAVNLSRGGGPGGEPAAGAVSLYVDPSGSDSNDGSQGKPFQTIQAALDEATPGTTINVGPGTYFETLATMRDGTPDAPITVKGPETGKDRSGRYRATVFSSSRVLNIDHSHYVFDGFTIDGQENLATTPYPTDLRSIDA